MTQSIIILRGLPGSGKSTYAEALLKTYNDYEKHLKPESLRLVRVNKDDIRAMLNGGPFFGSDDNINHCMYRIVEHCLNVGLSVVVDSMNFNPKHLEEFNRIVCALNNSNEGIRSLIQIEVHDFETPYGECLARNAKRAVPVPIDQMEIVRDTWCRNNTMNGFPEIKFRIDQHWRHHGDGIL